MKAPVTERATPRARDLQRRSTLEIVRLMNAEDAKVAPAVRRVLRAVARVADLAVEAIRAGGRVFYVGAGTSGRLGVLDASECPPTFRAPARWFQGVIAGGSIALRRSVEGAADSRAAGARALRSLAVDARDLVVGLSASGTTPFVVGAVRWANRAGAKTACVTCVPGSPLAKAARFPIAVRVGPEIVAGSTRLKAGTAQKLVLNMISTAAMVRMGRVFGSRMSHLMPVNVKLRRRAVSIAAEALGLSRAQAAAALRAHGGDLPGLLASRRGPR
jgi:N-acetylmuramic acid 6-phosphate etherase